MPPPRTSPSRSRWPVARRSKRRSWPRTSGKAAGASILNYGHTLGHALEGAALSGGHADWDLRHGEAVAIGLLFAALLAQRLGRIDQARVDEHRRIVGSYDLPTTLPPGAGAEELVDFMARDKKAQQDLTFVLDGPDGVEPVRGVARADVVATLAGMGAQR